jgi:hypothetical protein
LWPRAQHRFAQRDRDLVEVLVGERRAELVRAGFAQNGWQGPGRDGLGFVELPEERLPGPLRARDARQGGGPQAREDHETQQARVVFAQQSLGEVASTKPPRFMMRVR